MIDLEIGTLYKIREKIGWQVKHPISDSGKYQLLFPSVAINSNVGEVILILEKIHDCDDNNIVLFDSSAFTYKILTQNNEIVYMYTFTKSYSLEKIVI